MGKQDRILPPGVSRVSELPGHGRHVDWQHLFLPDGLKERLVNHALFSLLHRRMLNAQRLAIQGLIVFAGPPGTGKTTAARGLASAVAQALASNGSTTFVEFDPHALPSDLLGESQRNVAQLLGVTLPELAARTPFTIVLVDEVESFATRRSTASFDTNPADLHRATDAVLTGLDDLSATLPSVLFVVTTNFLPAVDEALLSRADLVVPFTLPDHDAVLSILRDTLDELSGSWPELRGVRDDPRLPDVAKECDGIDGRRIRKLVTVAFTYREHTARNPDALSIEDLLAAARDVAAGHELVASADT